MDTKINRIRLLLERYYDGATSPDEERELAGLLDSASPLPADLEPDRAMFKALAEASEADVPESLTRAIMEGVDARIRQTSKPRRQRFMAIAATLTAAAAAVMLIITPHGGGNLATGGSLTASAPTADTATLPAPTPTKEQSPAPEVKENQAYAPAPRRAKAVYAAARTPVAQPAEEEISPEEMEAMRNAFATLDKTGERLRRIDETIRDAGETTRIGIGRAAAAMSQINPLSDN